MWVNSGLILLSSGIDESRQNECSNNHRKSFEQERNDIFQTYIRVRSMEKPPDKRES